MRRSELKQIILEVIEESVYSGRFDVTAPKDFEDKSGNKIKFDITKNGNKATYSAWITTADGKTDSLRRYLRKAELVKDAKARLKEMINEAKDKEKTKEECGDPYKKGLMKESKACCSYEKFFTKKLKEYDADDIGELTQSEKKKFFNELERGWTKEEGTKGSYQSFFMNKLKNEYDTDELSDLSKSEKKTFFNELDACWKGTTEEGIIRYRK